MTSKQFKFKSLDAFGREVYFFYKGQEKYQTNWGTVVTILVATGFLTMFALLLPKFFGETDTVQYFSETRQDLD